MAGQVAAFHTEFQQALAQAGNAYVQAEAAGAAALAGALGVPVTSAAAPAATIPPFPANLTTLVMGGTGIPIPGPGFINLANELYVRSANALLGLNTPEELYPLTGTKSLTLDASVSEGLTILDNAIMEQLAIPGNTVTVFGVSQSAVIASLEMQKLAALGPAAPTASQLNFVLLGNEMNPNGGLLARFPDLSIPSLGLTFYGGTPSDTIYPTANYTLEYDGFADFPRYPLNFISDLNAVMDIVYVHPTYLDLTQGSGVVGLAGL
ncbi:PE-PPE domain-containing protein [Mycobacterium ulcerans]|nr:PE-PPE domain-containing protein [Mycobacterium ulcerans]